jgi:hypothetical protein
MMKAFNSEVDLVDLSVYEPFHLPYCAEEKVEII